MRHAYNTYLHGQPPFHHLMKPAPGSYILVLRNPARQPIQIGKWRSLVFQAGFYLYTGSAFGPGGVRARLGRHLRESKSLRWHIDYLRAVTKPYGAFISYEAKRLEHLWAQQLSTMRAWSATEGFGCSDCQCRSHLFHSSAAPDIQLLHQHLEGAPAFCPC